MKLLILGGTIFYGRHVTEEALRRGHEVTLFTRGLHNTDLFEGATKLQGERDGGLSALNSGSWDAVLDTCGYVPRVVRQSTDLLRGRVKTYAFVSSVSAYSDEAVPPITEESLLAGLEDPTTEIVDGATYGGLKVLSEQVVREVYDGDALIIRPGLIVGPYDSSDRFTYWPWRMHQGGDVLIPDRPDQAVQIIDARDLANFTLDCLEAGTTGTFHGIGTWPPYELGPILERIRNEVQRSLRLVPIPIDRLEAEGVKFWTELPLSHGAADDNLMRCDNSKAVGAGLKIRPLEETVRDTLAFALARGPEHPWRNGLPREKEERILEAWRAEGGNRTT